MKKLFSLRKLFRQSFEDHEGRPGKVGGSLPRSSSSSSNETSVEAIRKTSLEQANRVSGAMDRVEVPKYNADAIFRYKDEDYKEINEGLRAGKGEDAGWEVEYIDFSMKKSKVPEDVVVYRGISSSVYNNLKPGGKFKDKAYVSTSFDLKFAQDFSGGSSGSSGTVLIIDVPKGSKGLYTDNILARDEMELLLPRNSRFEVMEKFSEGGYNYIRVRKS